MDDGKTKLKSEEKEEISDDSDLGESGEASMSEGEDSEKEDEVGDLKEDEDLFDKYTIDPFLVRREATLLTLVKEDSISE